MCSVAKILIFWHIDKEIQNADQQMQLFFYTELFSFQVKYSWEKIVFSVLTIEKVINFTWISEKRKVCDFCSYYL